MPVVHAARGESLLQDKIAQGLARNLWKPLVRIHGGSRWLSEQAASGLLPCSAGLLLTGRSMAVQPSMLRCRVRATEAVGIIVAAVGMDVLGGALQEFVAAALQVGAPLSCPHGPDLTALRS